MTTLQQQARALGDPTRHAIFTRIAEADRPVGVSELTEHVALNHNAVRQHLARLVAAELILETKAAAVRPGRPRFEYVVNPAFQGQWGTTGPYEQLSLLLAEVITTGRSPEEVGRRAADRFRVPSPSGDVVADIGAAMARQGFAPDLRPVRGGVEMVLHNCPYASTATGARDTVCSLHLGIAEGLADGTNVVIDELIAQDPRTADCRLRIRVDATDENHRPTTGKLTLRARKRRAKKP